MGHGLTTGPRAAPLPCWGSRQQVPHGHLVQGSLRSRGQAPPVKAPLLHSGFTGVPPHRPAPSTFSGALHAREAVPPAVRGLSGAPGGKEPHGQLVCLKRPFPLWLLVLTLRKHDPSVQAKPECAWRGCGQGRHGRSRTHSAPVSPPPS